jgi:ATP-dependent DNA helicase RecQ
MSESIKCTDCGAAMVLRTARKGRNRGKQFYGCSAYPRCRTIIDLSEVNSNVGDSDKKDASSQDSTSSFDYSQEEKITLPVFLQARERLQDYQVRFYETMAFPHKLLEEIYNGNLDRENIKYTNQWRLDYPLSIPPLISDDIKQVLIVALKILTRGSITLTSPRIEEELCKQFGVEEENMFVADPEIYINYVNVENKSNYWLDGKGTEHQFYQEVLPKILGSSFRKYVIPQVYLSSLLQKKDLDEATSQQRVDFLITKGNKKVVVELEGIEHEAHKSVDDYRKSLLENDGYTVIQIKNQEIENDIGANLQQLYDIFDPEEYRNDFTELEKYLVSIKVTHQLQVIILEAILSGYITLKKAQTIYLDSDSLSIKKDEIKFIIDALLNDIKELLKHLSKLYDVRLDTSKLYISEYKEDTNTGGIVVTYNENLNSALPKFIIQNISFPLSIAHLDRPVRRATLESSDRSSLEYFLYYVFRHKEFKEGQFEAITRVLNGDDVVVLLPTGAGKSVAYQLATVVLPGVAIIVDPIISLIDDQIDNLQRIGIDRAIGITSQITNPITKSKIIKMFGQGEYIFCYIAPERFQTEEFRNSLKSLTVNTPVSLVAIDEAHCVSEWGHDFRTAYLNIGRTSRKYCTYEGKQPPLLALTGTASNSVLRDMRRELQIDDFEAIITPKTFDRVELNYSVFECSSHEKKRTLNSVLQRRLPDQFGMSASSFYQVRGSQTNSGLLFCPHVGGNFGIVEYSEQITSSTQITTKYYGGTSPKNWKKSIDWNRYKRNTAKEFKSNKFPLLVATKSFGMGIDKPNIRYTVHSGLPNSIESFYQEAGRAGRDRMKAECIILISNDNKQRTSRLLKPDSTIMQMADIMKNERNWDTDDDITRAMWFHLNSFAGVPSELETIENIINELSDFAKERKVRLISKGRDSLKEMEKGIHRLLILGVVSDYTINYSSNEFSIVLSGLEKEAIIDCYLKYVNGYNKGRVSAERSKVIENYQIPLNGFIKTICKILIEFVYDTVERGRRRALREILSLSESALKGNANEIVRKGILRYLETTFSEEIEEILNEHNSFNNVRKLVDGCVEAGAGETIGGIRSPKDAEEIRGQTARYLESTPDHPGLLFLRAISEIYSKDCNLEIIIQNIEAGFGFAVEKYRIDRDEVYDLLIWISIQMSQRRKSGYYGFISKLLSSVNDSAFARQMLNHKDADADMLYAPGMFLIYGYSKEVLEVYN